jgi:hypothetical protein
VSAFQLTRQVLRLFPRVWSIAKLARIEAEALVWRHGTAGVEAARERERMGRSGSPEERVLDWMVRLLAEREYELLSCVDVGTRYDIVAEWASRPGQMILTDRAAGKVGGARRTRLG